MPVPNASLTPDETVQWSPSGPAALALTTSGALRVQRPRGPLVQAGTVNLIRNPLANTNVTGWLPVSTSVARLTTDTYKGATATVQVTPTGVSIWSARQDVIHGLVQGNTYTYSIFLKGVGSSIGKKVRLFMTRMSGATQGGTVFTPDIVLTGTYQRVSLSTVVSESGVDVLRCGLYSPTNVADYPTGVPMLASHIQTELGPIATEFVDPDDPDTYWIADANNSPSVRPDRFAEMPLGWFVEEATVNYDPNPISASVVHPFNAYTYISGSRITNAGLNHPTAGLIDTATRMTLVSPLEHTSVVGTRAGSAASLGYSIAVGAVATQQIWFRASPKWIGKTIYAWFVIVGTGQSITKPVIATGDWQYVDLTLTVTTEGGTAFYVYIDSEAGMIGDASMVGEWIDFTATQLEQKAYATSLAVHTMGAGYSLGAANVTNRVVATPYVTLPMPADQGSIYVRYLAGSTPTSRHIGGFGQIGGAGSRALIPNISSGNQMNLRQGQYFHGLATVSDWNQIRGVYAEYNGNQVAVDYRDGVGKRYFIRTGNPPPPTWTNDMIPIGWSGADAVEAYTLPLNGYVFAIAAFPRPLTADEIAALEAIPTENLSYASIVGIGPQLGGLLLTHPDPGFAVLRTHGGM